MADSGQIRIKVSLEDAIRQLSQLNDSLSKVGKQSESTNKKLTGLSTSSKTQTEHLRNISKAVQQLVSLYDKQTQAMNILVQQNSKLNTAQEAVQKSSKGIKESVTNISQASKEYTIILTSLKKKIDSLITVESKLETSQRTSLNTYTLLKNATERLTKARMELRVETERLIASEYKLNSQAGKSSVQMSSSATVVHTRAQSASVSRSSYKTTSDNIVNSIDYDKTASSIKNATDHITRNTAAYKQNRMEVALVQRALKLFPNLMQSTSSELSNLVTRITSVAVAWQAFSKSLQVSVQLDSLSKTFYAITGSMTGASFELDYLKELSQELGLEFMALAQSYKGFSAATKYANMDLATTKQLFESVAKSATVLGLSGEKTRLVLMALEQMVSKGVVSMEELRRQLGDSLPGAFELGAKAMNMSIAEFNKYVASGQLLTEDFLPKFAEQLEKTYGTMENVALAVRTPRAEIQKLVNELTFAMDLFARQGFLEEVKQAVVSLRTSLQSAEAQNSLVALGAAFGTVVTAVVSLSKVLVEHSSLIGGVAVGLAALKVATMAVQGAQVAFTVALRGVVSVVSLYSLAVGSATIKSMALAMGLKTTASAARVLWMAINPLLGISVFVGTLFYSAKSISSFSEEVKGGAGSLDSFGVSASEADSEIARFMMTVQQVNPLQKFDEQIDLSKQKLQELAIASKTTMDQLDKEFFNQAEQEIKQFKNLQEYVQAYGVEIDVSVNIEAAKNRIRDLEPEVYKVYESMRSLSADISSGIVQSGDAAKLAVQGIREQIQKLEKTSELTALQEKVRSLREEMKQKPNDSALKNAYDTAEQELAAYVQQQEEKLSVLKKSYGILAQQVVSFANIVEQEVTNKLNKKLEEFHGNWISWINMTKEGVVSLQQLYGENFGSNWSKDIKQLDASISLYEKLWTKSDEYKKLQKESSVEQIANMEKVIEAKKNIVLAEAEIRKSIYLTKIEQAKASATSIGNLIKLVASYQAVADSIDASTEQQIKALDELQKHQATILQTLNEQDKKKTTSSVGSGSSNYNRELASLQDFQQRVKDTESTLEQLRKTYQSTYNSFYGQSIEGKLADIAKEREKQFSAWDKTLGKMQNKLDSMRAGSEKEAAVIEYNNLAQNITEAKELYTEIDKIKEAAEQYNSQQEQFTAGIEYWESQYNAAEAYRLKIQQLQAQQEQLLTKASSGDQTSQYQADALTMKIKQAQNMFTMNDSSSSFIEKFSAMLDEAQTKMGSFSTELSSSAMDTFTNILPNAIDQTISSFSSLFTEVLSGSMTVQEAFQSFGNVMQSLAKLIIQTLIEVAIKMLVVKALMAAFGGGSGGTAAEDGATVSGTSVKEAAKGRIVSGIASYEAADGRAVGRGGRIIPMASGGILTGPRLFGTKGGDTILAGEAGPEAFVPLGRTKEGKLGIETTGGLSQGTYVNMTVNVHNNASDQVQTSQQQGVDSNGAPMLDIFITRIESMLADRVATGTSKIGRAIDKTRGTSIAKGLY